MQSIPLTVPYWSYYEEDFEWPDHRLYRSADPKQTLTVLQEAGMMETDAIQYVKSGYVYCKISGTIIDRYYGGALMSRDPRCRWTPEEFCEKSWRPQNGVKVFDARSWTEVRDLVEEQRKMVASPRRIFLRGQIMNYTLDRPVPNPSYVVQGIGEISLMPNIWRKMLSKRSDSLHEFEPPPSILWSAILNRFFDAKDIERRRLDLVERGEWINSFQDMEDCEDEVLRNYGKLQLDLAYGSHVNLASTMVTLLQHYGLLSPVLDLTTEFEVARFFATHKLQRTDDRWHYDFVGTNEGQAVIYVVKENPREMVEHQSAEAVIKMFDALRPQRQGCVISMSSSFALNLPAEFVVALIRLDFKDDEGPVLDTKTLFPGADEDRFLKALQGVPISATKLIDFPH